MRNSAWRRFKRQRVLQVFVLLGIAYFAVFSIAPMFGILMAFKDYKITMGVNGIFSSDWVGFRWFIEFFNEFRFSKLVRNTIILSLLKLVMAFPMPILFALILNELRVMKFKRFVQTISYLPHFISWIIVAGLLKTFFSESSGVINQLFKALGWIDKPILFLADPNYFYGIAVGSSIWKETGWWAIIFLAAIIGVDPQLYEAAEIDGASRLKRIWHITLPSIKSTIVVVLILALGSLLGGGLSGDNFEQSYLLGNAANSDTSEIIQTYVFRVGLANARYAYATAVGLIQSVISLLLVLGSNFTAKKVSGYGIF